MTGNTNFYGDSTQISERDMENQSGHEMETGGL